LESFLKKWFFDRLVATVRVTFDDTDDGGGDHRISPLPTPLDALDARALAP
jgi:hypothetical protein